MIETDRPDSENEKARQNKKKEEEKEEEKEKQKNKNKKENDVVLLDWNWLVVQVPSIAQIGLMLVTN